MQKDRGTTNYFTKEMLDMAMRLWTRSSISLIDVRRQLIWTDKPLLNYRLPTSTLLYTNGEMASIKLDELPIPNRKFWHFSWRQRYGTVYSSNQRQSGDLYGVI